MKNYLIVSRINLLFSEKQIKAISIFLLGFGVPLLSAAQTGQQQYARIAILRPNDNQMLDFEAGYVRHLEWHRQAGDSWNWYGWSIWESERQRWFIYGTFGHTATGMDSAVKAAEDDKDNLLNVLPHCELKSNSLYKYLPDLSYGSGIPKPSSLVEFTTIDIALGKENEFEHKVGKLQSTLRNETLWFRLLAGGTVPRYICLRPSARLSGVISQSSEKTLPDDVNGIILKQMVEILILRPNMSLSLPFSN